MADAGAARRAAKPSFGSRLEERRNKAMFVVVQQKMDGMTCYSYEDKDGLRHFIFPTSGKPMPFKPELLTLLRKECEGLHGDLHFELYCKQNGREHNFFGVLGLPLKLPKNFLSSADFHARRLTLVFLTSCIGRTAIERIRVGEAHFSRGTVRTTDQGELIWPYQPHLGTSNRIVTVLPCEVVMQHNLEAELARMLRDYSRPMSARVEGVVCHLVYDFGDARNLFRVCEDADAKANPHTYRNPHVFKVKMQKILTGRITEGMSQHFHIW